MMIIKLFISLFTLYCILITVIDAKIYICDKENSTVYLQKGKIAFFETSKFPTLRKWHNFCDLTFLYFNNQSDTNYQIFVVIKKFSAFSTILEYKNFEVFDQSSYSLEKQHLPYAQQGFILVEDKNEGCPMESVSRSQPFMFTDDSEVIHIWSSYYANYSRSRACKWQFLAPSGYGLKIVVEKFDVSSKTELVIQNDTDFLVSEKNLQLFHPYYSSGKWVLIYLSKGDPLFKADMEFQAYISIVKQNFTENIGDCFVKHKKGHTIWTNLDDQNNGYGRNMKCTYDLVIKPKTEIYVTIDEMVLEKGVDIIAYYDEHGQKVIIDYDEVFVDEPYFYNAFIFEPFYNGSEKPISFEFVSDGSVQSIGFEISFSEIVCECADPVITCDYVNYNGIIKSQNPLHPYAYCGNMKCIFTIKPCYTDYMLLIITDFKLPYPLYDFFRVISNGIVVAEFHSLNRNQKCLEVFLNSSNENILEIITAPTTVYKLMSFKVQPFYAPKTNLQIVLSADNPTVIIDTGLITLATVEISEELELEDVQLITYSNLVEYKNVYINTFSIFNNESLTYNIIDNVCFVKIPYKCNIKSRKFAIYTIDFDVAPFFAVRLSKNYGGCVFGETIFYIKDVENYKFGDLATEEADCLITILIDQFSYYYISDIWTSATSNENVSVFIGTDQTITYFEFNLQTASSWKDVKLFSKSYTIKIPKTSSLWIEFTKEEIPEQFVTILQYPSQSMIATPNFATSTADWNFKNGIFMTYIIGNFTAKFTVKEHKIPKDFEFYFLVEKKKLHFNKTGDSMVFKNQKISLHYVFPKKVWRKLDHGVLIYINTVF